MSSLCSGRYSHPNHKFLCQQSLHQGSGKQGKKRVVDKSKTRAKRKVETTIQNDTFTIKTTPHLPSPHLPSCGAIDDNWVMTADHASPPNMSPILILMYDAGLPHMISPYSTCPGWSAAILFQLSRPNKMNETETANTTLYPTIVHLGKHNYSFLSVCFLGGNENTKKVKVSLNLLFELF